MKREIAQVIGAMAVLGGLCFAGSAQSVDQKCGSHPNLLRQKSGTLIWFSSAELEQMAVKTVKPRPVPIKQMNFNGVVKINIMVNTSGDVVCLWNVKGHPLMLAGAATAAHDWKFKPKIQEGRPAEFVGTLELPVSTAANGM